ncbi:hypothetical protein [Flavobacterium pectinovorum]|uniref:hypothetical protein n=1 Tax=Flavobacterium pectinovorum TaxID=29533 RepID=UPI001FAE1538|nr:hypothetical protein [Flavobacterium pectinovorum]MCI9844558.1 hypothetical protein [Flavobacterium pectinovorum]
MEEMQQIISTSDWIALCALIISGIAGWYAYKGYSLSKTNFALDQINLTSSFALGIEKLKLIFEDIDRLKVKKVKDINFDNLKSDSLILHRISNSLSENEITLSNLYLDVSNMYGLRKRIKEIDDLVVTNSSFNHDVVQRISSSYGLLYFQAFLLRPHAFPKNYSMSSYEELNTIKNNFLAYHCSLVYKT